MPAKWVPMSEQKLTEDIIKPLQATLGAFGEIIKAMKQSPKPMPEHVTLLAQSHIDALNSLSGISLTVLQTMPDQVYSHNAGIDPQVIRLQEKNANDKLTRNAKAKAVNSSTPTKKAVKKKGAK